MIDNENTAVCWACGKREHVNAFGFCEKCWVTYAHLMQKEVKKKHGI